MKILNFDEYNDIDNEELIPLNYLKKLILDLEKYKSFDGSKVYDLQINFGAYEIGFVLDAKNKEDIQRHVEHFNMFCQQFDWCDKESLIIIEGEYGNDICWDAFQEEHGNIISAATEFSVYDNEIYMTIKLH